MPSTSAPPPDRTGIACQPKAMAAPKATSRAQDSSVASREGDGGKIVTFMTLLLCPGRRAREATIAKRWGALMKPR